MDDQSRALLAEKESLYKSMKQVQKISLWLSSKQPGHEDVKETGLY